MQIKEGTKTDADIITAIIRAANIAHLDIKNHPGSCQKGWIIENMAKGEHYYICYKDGEALGVIGSRIKAKELTIKHLAVLPRSQGVGIGSMLMDYILSTTTCCKVAKLGVINNNRELKEWYTRFGFIPGKVKVFKTLPFSICFMRKSL